MQPSSWSDKLYQDVDCLLAKERVSKPVDTPWPCDASHGVSAGLLSSRYPSRADNNMTVSDRDTLETLHRCALLGWTARAEQVFARGNTQHKERMLMRALEADLESCALCRAAARQGAEGGPGQLEWTWQNASACIR